jgi:hypothetical protein
LPFCELLDLCPERADEETLQPQSMVWDGEHDLGWHERVKWGGTARPSRRGSDPLQTAKVDVGVALRYLLQVSGISVDHFKFWVVLDIRDQLIFADFIILVADADLLAAATVGGHGIDVPARFRVVCSLRRS